MVLIDCVRNDTFVCKWPKTGRTGVTPSPCIGFWAISAQQLGPAVRISFDMRPVFGDETVMIGDGKLVSRVIILVFAGLAFAMIAAFIGSDQASLFTDLSV